jgi:hypothetical protein
MRTLKRLPCRPRLATEFAAQKRGDVVGLHGVDSSPGEVAVDRQVLLVPEDDVGGVLALVQ